MITSFRCKKTEKLFKTGRSKKFSGDQGSSRT